MMIILHLCINRMKVKKNHQGAKVIAGREVVTVIAAAIVTGLVTTTVKTVTHQVRPR